jgi:CelD/BcsL family acetyltransferase involved in cellulose biosynthesis
MDIQIVRDIQEFSALRAEWNDLLSRSSADTIFLTWEWLYSWWECYAGADDVLHILVVRENTGELIGLLPLYRKLQPWLPFRPVKSLRFIGDGSWDSDYLDAIVIKGRAEEIFAEVWKWLRSQRSSWDLLQFSGVPGTSSTCHWLKHGIENEKVIVRTENVSCLVTELPNSWEDYLASLKPRFRTKVRSTLRELNSRHQVRLRSIQTETDLKTGLEVLYDLHGQRWESKGSDGVFLNAAKRRFYERFSQLFLTRGWLAFDFLDLNERAVACQLCFRYRGTQFLLQEGFDPKFGSESVGIALRSMVFKQAIEDGIRHYDFLAGVGRHKTQWQAELKECQSISCGPRTLKNTLYLRVPIAIDLLKERVKMVLPAKLLEIHRSANAN